MNWRQMMILSFWGLFVVTLACIVGMLNGCTKYVNVPVPVACQAPPAVSRPIWPIAALEGDETYGEIIRAFGASLEAERGYSTSLETLLNGYRGGK